VAGGTGARSRIGPSASAILRNAITARTAARETEVSSRCALPGSPGRHHLFGNDDLVRWVKVLGPGPGEASELASTALHSYANRGSQARTKRPVDFHLANQKQGMSLYFDAATHETLMNVVESESRSAARVLLAAVGIKVQHRLAEEGLSASPIPVSNLWSDGISL